MYLKYQFLLLLAAAIYIESPPFSTKICPDALAICGPNIHSGPTDREVEDCSLPPPNMAATKTGEQGKAWFSVL